MRLARVQWLQRGGRALLSRGDGHAESERVGSMRDKTPRGRVQVFPSFTETSAKMGNLGCVPLA